ncbi:MAG: helix-turn-helix transcriptional regulator [Alkalispirochaeta sp.]
MKLTELNVFLRNVTAILSEKRITRAHLARRAGIPVSTINNWYVANRHPRVDQAVRIANSLDTTLDALMERPISAGEARVYDLVTQLAEEDLRIVADITAVLIEHQATKNHGS